MLNISNTNSNHRFHECMPKEVHAMYDILKLMEKQEDAKKIKVEADKKEEIHSKDKNENNALNTDTKNKNERLLDISA